MIYHLLYISQKSTEFNEERDLKKIINSSVVNNAAKEITGMLIKNGNFFIQMLEGKEKNVTKVYTDIAQDKRHMNIKTLMTFHSSTRIFPDWYMGLINGEDHELNIRDLVPFLHADILKAEGSQEKCVSILKRFNQIAK